MSVFASMAAPGHEQVVRPHLVEQTPDQLALADVVAGVRDAGRFDARGELGQ